MPRNPNKRVRRLEDLPNIGRSIAADLRAVGILSPEQLAHCDPLTTYRVLAPMMGRRADPCVLYTLLAVAHFQKMGEGLPWWHFTAQGQQLLASDPPSPLSLRTSGAVKRIKKAG